MRRCLRRAGWFAVVGLLSIVDGFLMGVSAGYIQLNLTMRFLLWVSLKGWQY